MMKMPHARIACVGRKSTVEGHKGSMNWESSCVEEYELRALPAQAVMTTPATRVMKETATRAQ